MTLQPVWAGAPWPGDAASLDRLQAALAAVPPRPWDPPAAPVVAGCFVAFPRGVTGPGAAGDRGWAAAAAVRADGSAVEAVVGGRASAPYDAGRLALREGSLLEAAARALPQRPDVLLVNATGRDHPRRAGLALHLGAVLDLPTIGVTHRPLIADGPLPAAEAGAWSALTLAGEIVGAWLRTRAGVRPIVVHAAWRTDVPTAVAIVAATIGRARTPQPLRLARRAARRARATASVGPAPGETVRHD